jgi:hypothetical protein
MNDESPTALDTEIDYEKSIKKQRLVNKSVGSSIFNEGFDYILVWALIAITSYDLFKQLTNAHSDNTDIGLCSFVIVWLIVNLFFNNILVKIQGKSIEKNKEDILNTFDAFYTSYNFIINNDQMMRSFEPEGSPVWGRRITILFKDDLMYLNITALGKTNSPTWIHGLFNFIKAKRIARYYRKHYFSN